MIIEDMIQNFDGATYTTKDDQPLTFDRLMEMIKILPPAPLCPFKALVEKYGHKDSAKIRMIVPKNLFVASGPTFHSMKIPEWVRFSEQLTENIFIIDDDEREPNAAATAMWKVTEILWDNAKHIEHVEPSELLKKMMSY